MRDDASGAFEAPFSRESGRPTSSSESVRSGVMARDREPELGPTAKEQIAAIIHDQPDDSTFDEILRELALHRMIARGSADLQRGRLIDDALLRARIRSWHP